MIIELNKIYIIIGKYLGKYIDSISNDLKRTNKNISEYVFPENSLCPTEQLNYLKQILQDDNKKIVLYTHSPYILFYISCLVKGYYIKNKLQNNMYLEDLSKLVPIDIIINPDNLFIYELNEEGIPEKLDTYKGMPTDNNYLNNMLNSSNELFTDLLELEDKIKNK